MIVSADAKLWLRNELSLEEILDNAWLARCPRPKEIGFDNGGEFKGEFSQLCKNMGLKAKTSPLWNPQSNAISERIHQISADCLRTFEMEDMDVNAGDADPFQKYLSEAACAIRCGFHATHGHSPGELVFGRNMFLPVETSVDGEALKERKQKATMSASQATNENAAENDAAVTWGVPFHFALLHVGVSWRIGER